MYVEWTLLVTCNSCLYISITFKVFTSLQVLHVFTHSMVLTEHGPERCV